MKTGVDLDRSGLSLLVCTTGERSFAVPITAVRETMRPMNVAGVPGMPDFVLGVARIRGAAVPVADSGLLTGGSAVQAQRWITLSVSDHRQVALAVHSVAGIRTLTEDELQMLPPLLSGAQPQFTAISTRDHELLLVLQTSRLIPDEVWDQVLA